MAQKLYWPRRDHRLKQYHKFHVAYRICAREGSGGSAVAGIRNSGGPQTARVHQWYRIDPCQSAGKHPASR
jgi:hypothetical protein